MGAHVLMFSTESRLQVIDQPLSMAELPDTDSCSIDGQCIMGIIAEADVCPFNPSVCTDHRLNSP